MNNSELITFAVAMVAITNPVGNLAIFAGLTSDDSPDAQRKTAAVSAIAVAVILLVSAWVGQQLLKAFGITVPMLEAAGGLIVVRIGLSMLQAKTSEMHHNQQDQAEAQAKPSIAVVPLAIPLVSGPGTMATVIIQAHKFPSVEEKGMISLVCVGIAILTFIAFYFAGPVSKLLGTSGINIVTRIMGIVLTAIAFGMLASGLTKLMPGLAT